MDAIDRPRRPARSPLFTAALAFVLAGSWAASARADIPPSCDAEASLITCAAADVGKPCRGGGKCFEVQCASGGDGVSKVYKCDACPTIIAAPSGTCTIGNMGSACSAPDGGTGTCGAIRSYCNPSADKYVCQTPSTETPTGPPGGGGSSGCDIAPNPKPGPTIVGFALVALGLVLVIAERARRRRGR